MKRSYWILALLGLALPLWLQRASAAGEQPSPAGETLCLPAAQGAQDGCLALGPAAYLRQMAELGMAFPLEPLPAKVADSGLGEVPYQYARVTAQKGRVYASLGHAIAGKPVKRYIQPGFDFVSYIDVAVVDGKRYYQISRSEWMRGGELAGNVAPSTFAGLEFSGTPQRRFGWVLYPIETLRTPGYHPPDYSGYELDRYDIVQVYDTAVVNGREWYLVAPDQWIEQRHLALVYPNPIPPTGIASNRWIEVNLFEQTVSIYEDNRLVYATLVSSGTDTWWTRPGLFQIREKLDSTSMRGAFEPDRSDYYFLEDVPWTMYYDQARALHGAYWHNSFGYQRSHGCVNLALADARWFYDWARVGDWVYVWDPSGETPVDPRLYTPGGA